MTTTDWNAATTTTAPKPGADREDFLVTFTGNPTGNYHTLGQNNSGQTIYAKIVTLVEGYTNFDSIPNILKVANGDDLTPIYAQPVDPSGETWPDPAKAVKWF